MDDCLKEFLIESFENLAKLDQEIVILEKDPGNHETLQNIFRTIHTIKGTCGMLQLQRLEKVAHVAEELLDKMRQGGLPIESSVIDPLLGAIDVIKVILKDLEASGIEPQGDDTEVIHRLESLLLAKATVAAPMPSEGKGPVSKPGEESSSPLAEHSLRVSVDIIDQLINVVGELVLTRNQLVQLVQGKDESEYMVPIQQLNRVTSGLQEVVMKTRMQPIGNAWSKLPRLVRDLSRTMGKKISLHMNGSETEVDRQILQAIQDPLIHCVRNSADHGLEAPDVREKSGKPEEGSISLNAFHEGGHIIVEIQDDGQGIDLEAVKAKALAQGLIDKETAGTLSESQIMALIFEPGFSTAKKVTEVSGRGVGMDVVKTNIERIGGSVDVSSKRGVGTTIRIKIPLTLAIIPALVIGVGRSASEVFAIPQVGVVELVRIGEANQHLIEEIHGSRILRLRDTLLPLLDLGAILGIGSVFDKKKSQQDLAIVVAQAGETQFGLCVDEIFDTQEIVVKPVGSLVRDINLFAGTTILGDGRVILIIDIARIASKLTLSTSKATELDRARANSSAVLGEKAALLLFKGGQTSAPMAVPLALVARLEEFNVAKIEEADGRHFIQYRNSLLPLIACRDSIDPKAVKASGQQTIPAVIFSDHRRSMGLLVSEIMDVVEEHLNIESSSKHQGVLGTAIVSGKATEVVDTYHYLQRAYPDWFRDISDRSKHKKRRVLLAEDSRFFQDLIRPVLETKGYLVTVASDGSQALAHFENGEKFDIVISDIEMPVMDGISLAKAVKAHPVWRQVPMLALSSLATPPDMKRGIEAGFKEYLVKFDQDTLLRAIDRTLNESEPEGQKHPQEIAV